MPERNHLVLALVALGFLLVGCSGGSTPEEITFLNHDPSVEYVGRDTCRRCHLGIYSTYVQTGMGRSFYPMTPEVAVEDFSDNNTFVDPATGLRYLMEARDGKYYQRQFYLSSKGEEMFAEEHELLYALGSNNHSRGYVLEMEGKLFQAPLCWYPRDEIWDFCPGFEHKNDNFTREITGNCLFCHNDIMNDVEGTRNRFEKPYPHGIGCERCHGPGQLHVERWSSGDDTPSGGADPTIVHPRRLPHLERMSVCLQCHLGDSKATERVVRRDVSGVKFYPGQALTEINVTLHYSEHLQWDFGLLSQGDRLMLSRCFSESGNGMDCLTCHNPHISVYHEDRAPDMFRLVCLGCHQVDTCPAPPAERDATSPLVDDCVACHMRRAEADDQRHADFTDHWIRRNIDLQERDRREGYRIEPMFPEQFAALTPAEQAYYEGMAYSLLPEIPPKVRPTMLAWAEESLQKAIDEGMDEAPVWHTLGQTQGELRKFAPAIQSLERSYEMDPSYHDGTFALGQAMLGAKQFDRALSIFRELIERDPTNVMALSEAGRTVTELNRIDEAIAFYREALSKEPWHAHLHHNVGMLLASQGRFEEAAREGAEALRLNPDDRTLLEFYARVQQAAGHPERSAEVVRLIRGVR